MKRLLTLCLSTVMAAISFSSCEETKDTDDRHNWKERNAAYISDIAAKCDISLTEKDAGVNSIFRILSFKLNPKESDHNITTDYVYCQILAKGDGKECPLYTDSVRINFRLRLIPTDNFPNGQVLDQSYTTQELDPEINIPASFVISGLVDGVATALQHMKTGDSWRLYIPYSLGYGKSNVRNVPGYSTLIFDLNLVEYAKTGNPLSLK